MDDYLTLEWDSAFFGFTVARVLPERLEPRALARTLERMKEQKVALAYWSSDPEDAGSQLAAREAGGFLADRKVTFVIEGEELLAAARQAPTGVSVEEYREALPSPDLEELALQAGVFSRFKIDPRMPERLFERLYTVWIRESVAGRIADAVLVVRRGERLVGMVTVGEKKGRADIGLIAVDPGAQGQGLGVSLVRAAQRWAVERGYRAAQVVTQGDNRGACRLYQKCGYRMETVENIFHFWMAT